MPVATSWPLVGRRGELDVFTDALQDPACQALCIYGPSGVGKTRLGDECLKVAETSGRRVLRATPDQSNSAVPLAALAHLLPARALTDWHDAGEGGSVVRTRLLDTAVRALAPSAGESGGPVLLADDAHRFDRSSLTVVDHLMARGAVFCVATVNADEPVPETVIEWWRDDRAIRMDLAELDPVGVDTLLHVVLEGPLDGPASAALWTASQGNVLDPPRARVRSTCQRVAGTPRGRLACGRTARRHDPVGRPRRTADRRAGPGGARRPRAAGDVPTSRRQSTGIVVRARRVGSARACRSHRRPHRRPTPVGESRSPDLRRGGSHRPTGAAGTVNSARPGRDPGALWWPAPGGPRPHRVVAARGHRSGRSRPAPARRPRGARRPRLRDGGSARRRVAGGSPVGGRRALAGRGALQPRLVRGGRGCPWRCNGAGHG